MKKNKKTMKKSQKMMKNFEKKKDYTVELKLQGHVYFDRTIPLSFTKISNSTILTLIHT